MEQRRIERAWFFIFLAAVTVAFLWLTLDFIEPVFWAAVLAIIFNPLQRQLEELLRKGARRRPRSSPRSSSSSSCFFRSCSSAWRCHKRRSTSTTGFRAAPSTCKGFVTQVDPILRDVAVRVGIDPATIGPRISESIGAAAQLIATRAVVVGQNLLSVVGTDGADALSALLLPA